MTWRDFWAPLLMLLNAGFCVLNMSSGNYATATLNALTFAWIGWVEIMDAIKEQQ